MRNSPPNSDRFLRLKQIIGDDEKGIPPLVPVSRTAWCKGVKSGRFPAPAKKVGRLVFWRDSDIQALIAGGAA